ncbi:hypothetical protein GCM10011309_01830 [Litorimonas cladophorae]|uniref:Uncharacterized protein n=1 Tax=Litorimonas cladophorae TaxID=1220491 RepID=A0A918KAZ2_9PROT|nr:hypothetical protein [Litorimonas cladophorae]GGX56621.1 hypothetical protein GCM10011309_01830 [Litorimonas cladophorae]
MILRDLSFWGFVKVSLFIALAVPALFIIPVGILAIFNPEAVMFDTTSGTPEKMLGILVLDGTPNWVQGVFAFVVNLLATSKILHLIAQLTPVGKVKISK